MKLLGPVLRSQQSACYRILWRSHLQRIEAGYWIDRCFHTVDIREFRAAKPEGHGECHRPGTLLECSCFKAWNASPACSHATENAFPSRSTRGCGTLDSS